MLEKHAACIAMGMSPSSHAWCCSCKNVWLLVLGVCVAATASGCCFAGFDLLSAAQSSLHNTALEWIRSTYTSHQNWNGLHTISGAGANLLAGQDVMHKLGWPW